MLSKCPVCKTGVMFNISSCKVANHRKFLEIGDGIFTYKEHWKTAQHLYVEEVVSGEMVWWREICMSKERLGVSEWLRELQWYYGDFVFIQCLE